MDTIAVIGSGTMGNGIAHLFAQYGYTVNLIDISDLALETGMRKISVNLDRQLSKGVISEEHKTSTLRRITTFTTLEQGIKNAGMVVEAASERIDLKLALFKELADLCPPQTILATNTSSISITKIASATRYPARVIGMHFMNPVPVMKLVEVICGYATSPDVVKTVVDLAIKLDNHLP